MKVSQTNTIGHYANKSSQLDIEQTILGKAMLGEFWECRFNNNPEQGRPNKIYLELIFRRHIENSSLGREGRKYREHHVQRFKGT